MRLVPASWRWRVGLAAAAALGVWLGHGWLLGGLASPLMSTQSADGVAALALWGGERGAEGVHAFDAAAAFYRQDPSRHILLIGRRGGRLVELGILAPFATLARRELTSRGVPEAAIEGLPATAADQWDEAQLLAAWLSAPRRHGGRLLQPAGQPPGAFHCRPRGRAGGCSPRRRCRPAGSGPRRDELVEDPRRHQEFRAFLAGVGFYVVSRPAAPGLAAAERRRL